MHLTGVYDAAVESFAYFSPQALYVHADCAQTPAEEKERQALGRVSIFYISVQSRGGRDNEHMVFAVRTLPESDPNTFVARSADSAGTSSVAARNFIKRPAAESARVGLGG